MMIISTWFTPTTLFCFLNLIILTILLISRWKKPDPHPPQLSRVDSLRAAAAAVAATGPSSILQRVKSIDFSSSFQCFNQTVVVEETPAASQDVKSLVKEKDERQSTTNTNTNTNTNTRALRERKGKSGATTTTGEKEKGGVDEKADDFINRFRQQLKLQRLDSILRYKEMLNRGR